MSILATSGKCQVLSLGMLPKELRSDRFIQTYFSCDKDGSGVLESVNLNHDNEFDKLPQKVLDAVLPYAISGEAKVSGRITGPNACRNNVFNTTIFDENGEIHSSVTLNAKHFEYSESGATIQREDYAVLSERQYARLVDRRDSARTEVDKQEREQQMEMVLNYWGKTQNKTK